MSIKQRYDRSDIRRMNAVSVLNQLRIHGSLSRAQIAARLGLTRATVSNIATDLLQASLISETEYDAGGAGRPGLLLNLNPDCGSMIAVGVDLDRISVVLANVGQAVLWRAELPIVAGAPADVSLDGAADLVEQALELSAEKGLRCFGLCVAWAGLVNRADGQLAYGPTFGWEHVPLKASWESRFGVPVYVENEAHAGALGVYHLGPYAGTRNLIYLSLGVGLAAGVFVDGVLLRGNEGFAGQVGHSYFADNGVECSCGKRGCWVTEIGVSAVRRKLEAAGVELVSDIESGVDWLDLVLRRAREGDAVVLDVLDEVGRQLGRGASRLVETFNPSILLIGGRLGPLMKLVEPVILEAMNVETLPYMAEPLGLVVSGSLDDHLQGCLATVFDAIMNNPSLGVG